MIFLLHSVVKLKQRLKITDNIVSRCFAFDVAFSLSLSILPVGSLLQCSLFALSLYHLLSMMPPRVTASESTTLCPYMSHAFYLAPKGRCLTVSLCHSLSLLLPRASDSEFSSLYSYGSDPLSSLLSVSLSTTVVLIGHRFYITA